MFNNAKYVVDRLAYESSVPLCSGVASPKMWAWGKKFFWTKMFDFRRITLFCLEKRLWKHKMTIFS